MKIRILSLIITLTINSFLFSQNRDSSQSNLIQSNYFSDVPMAAFLDSLATSVMFKGRNIYADSSALNVHRYRADEIPQFPDSVYKSRLRNMDIRSPFHYVYNEDVRTYIDLYAQRRRPMTSRLLGLAAYYFPLFEEQLARHNLPLELKYLAVIESALNSKAISRVGAAGLWQFMYRTGKMYGLEVTSFVDDRFDPYKATVAACEHFEDLYRIYKDWSLVLAAYNAGSGNVNRAIRRANGELDYWKIRRFLPRETQGYVPIFIAASYVLNYATEHNLYPVYPGYLFNETDTVTIEQRLSFEQLSEALSIPVDELVALNPTFKMNVIPSCDSIKYVINMPLNKVGEFLANDVEIYSFKTYEQLVREDLAARNPSSLIEPTKTHTVRSGETLNTIARRYGITVSNIQKWNSIRGTTIHPGQRLIVSVEAPRPVVPEPPRNTRIEQYVVKREDNLRTIAQRFECSVDNLRLWNNLRNLSVEQGQILTIHIPIPDELAPADSTEGELIPQTNTSETSGLNFINELDNNVNSDETTINSLTQNNFELYIVKEGDTLWSIAQNYEGVSIDDIKQINNLENSSILPGQQLKLPLQQKG
ncbi:MAG: LysM peptidoglycan-binding domain-containing protein [Bacteroidales bacterium]|nr:LysM peptidoglycan-binding domain-containing protein [Bacteroidales bacterium]